MAEPSQSDIVDEVPEGYLTVIEFAKRVDRVPATVRAAQKSGELKRVLWLRKGETLSLLVHESEIARFVRVRHGIARRGPAPLAKRLSSDGYGGNDDDANLVGSDLSDTDPFTIGNKDVVKLLKEQIATKRARLELQKAENELIDTAVVEQKWREIALCVKQAILSIVPRLSPILAAEPDARKCGEILRNELTEALSELSRTAGSK